MNDAPPFDTGLHEAWEDLPGNFALWINASGKWTRSRTWGTKGYGRYVRTDAARFSVGSDGHEMLKRCLRAVATAHRWVYDEIGPRVSGFALVEGDMSAGTHKVPRTLKVELTNRFRGLMGEEAMQHPWGFAGLNAAMRAVDDARMEAMWGRKPTLGSGFDDLPCGVTVRLPCGVANGKPIAASGSTLDLGVEGLGPIMLRGMPPKNVSMAAYAEVAQWERSWWIRFVYQGDLRPDIDALQKDHGRISSWNLEHRFKNL